MNNSQNRMTNEEYNRLHQEVMNFPTKHSMGFINSEIEELLSRYPNASLDKFQEALMCHTCMLIDNELITYHNDILLALTCAIENRDPTVGEWD